MKNRRVFYAVIAGLLVFSLFTCSLTANADIKGDCCYDSVINSKDTNYLLRFLANHDMSKLDNFKKTNCDLNGDGKINVCDALKLRLMMVNLENTTTRNDWSPTY